MLSAWIAAVLSSATESRAMVALTLVCSCEQNPYQLCPAALQHSCSRAAALDRCASEEGAAQTWSRSERRSIELCVKSQQILSLQYSRYVVLAHILHVIELLSSSLCAERFQLEEAAAALKPSIKAALCLNSCEVLAVFTAAAAQYLGSNCNCSLRALRRILVGIY